MRVPREQILGEPGQANYYHVVSRVAGRELVFGDAEKEYFRGLLDRQLRFSGLNCLAWCFMGNHFHLLLEVPDKEAALEGWTADDYLERLGTLASEAYTRRVLSDVKMWRENGSGEAVAKVVEGVRSRLFDLSRFMQEFKHKFSMWFNKRHGRRGMLWEERFKSVLVEGKGGSSADGPGGLLAVAAYIDLNPVRAGIVGDPKDYRWCSYAAAMAGDKDARAGISKCAGARNNTPWRRVAAAYRETLFGSGEERVGGSTADGRAKAQRGFTRSKIESVLRRGGGLPLAVLLRCRVRYFSEGVALGGKEFLREFRRRRRKRDERERGFVEPNRVGGSEALGLLFANRRKRDGISPPG